MRWVRPNWVLFLFVVGISFVLCGCDQKTANDTSNTIYDTWTFTADTASQYDYDPSLIEISGDAIRLKESYATAGDDSSSEFAQGTLTDVEWVAGSSAIALSSGETSGTFTSRVIDVGWPTLFNAVQWVPVAPAKKAFPDNVGVETAYTSGNFSMASNVLLMHFDVEEGDTDFADTSGQDNDGTCATCPALAEGKFLVATDFDGVNDSITVPDDDTLDVTSTYTVMAWIKTDTAMGAIYSHKNAAGAKQGMAFIVGGAGVGMAAGRLAMWSNGQNGWVGGGASVIDDAWHHVAVTYNGTTARFYIDGAETTNAAMTAPTASTNSATIGNSPDNYVFNGLMDELAVFSRTLTAAEILNAYKRGATRLKFQARVCDDELCDGEDWVGADGTDETYFTEELNDGIGTPSLEIIAGQRYFQYQVVLETDNATYTPALKSFSMSYRVHTAVFTNRNQFDFAGLVLIRDTPAEDNDGFATYQVSRDGTNWYWHDGNHWIAAAGENIDESNLSLQIILKLRFFHIEVGGGTFHLKVFLRTLLGLPVLKQLEVLAFES